jgi:1-phosphofructokinase family hexose kinase
MSLVGGPELAYDILAVSPNAAVDSYYLLSELAIGKVNRAEKSLHTAGGKGNNLSRAVSALGGKVLSLGIVGGHTGKFIVEELQREQIPNDMVWAKNETRRSSTLILPDQMQTTVVLDSGARVEQEAAEILIQRIQDYASQAHYLVLTGSLPPTLPSHYYADIIQRIKNRPNLEICVDFSGEALRLAVEAGVHVIKVNCLEFRDSFTSGESWNLSSATDTFAWLERKGLKLLVITQGRQGAYVFASGMAPFRVITRVENWVSTAGAGDTFMAGMLLGLGRGNSLETAMCYASAAAAAQLQQVMCGQLSLEDLESYLNETRVELGSFLAE